MQFDNVALDTRTAFAFTSSQTPAATNANISAAQEFTVVSPSPLKVGDLVFVSPPVNSTAVLVGAAIVSAADKIKVWFVNTSAGNLTHDAGVFGFLIVRP